MSLYVFFNYSWDTDNEDALLAILFIRINCAPPAGDKDALGDNVDGIVTYTN